MTTKKLSITGLEEMSQVQLRQKNGGSVVVLPAGQNPPIGYRFSGFTPKGGGGNFSLKILLTWSWADTVSY